jgi:hypothetical protein
MSGIIFPLQKSNHDTPGPQNTPKDHTAGLSVLEDYEFFFGDPATCQRLRITFLGIVHAENNL